MFLNTLVKIIRIHYLQISQKRQGSGSLNLAPKIGYLHSRILFGYFNKFNYYSGQFGNYTFCMFWLTKNCHLLTIKNDEFFFEISSTDVNKMNKRKTLIIKT